jgi:hypothetical protein
MSERNRGLYVDPAERIIWRRDLLKQLAVHSNTVSKWMKTGKIPPPDLDLGLHKKGWKMQTLWAHGIHIAAPGGGESMQELPEPAKRREIPHGTPTQPPLLVDVEYEAVLRLVAFELGSKPSARFSLRLKQCDRPTDDVDTKLAKSGRPGRFDRR